MTTASSSTSDRSAPISGPVITWLVVVAILIVAIILVGGATRLTDSGLSITEWKPILGVIPPLNDADWQTAFAKYKQIPEYKQINPDMILSGFKVIYWWEWAHRFLGRIIGVVFLLPFLWFLMRGQIPRRLWLPLAGLFVLGGLQGALGWYMVQSGLADRVDVSQYRLAAHLGLAVVIYAAIVWIVLKEGQRRDLGEPAASSGLRLSAMILVGLIFLQIIAGAFVAGMNAGLSHNTWPLMDGKFIPDGLGVMSPGWRNIFENALTVQFVHRMLAYAIVLWAFCHAVAVLRGETDPGKRQTVVWLVIFLLVQVGIGIWTLLAAVPLHLGLIHQLVAVIAFTSAMIHASTMRSLKTA